MLSEWELFFGHYNLTFVLLDPNNQIVWHKEITLNNTISDEPFIRNLVRPTLSQNALVPGMWKIVILNQMNVISATKFMVIPSGSSQTMSNDLTPASIAHSPKNSLLARVMEKFIHGHNVFCSPTDHLFWYMEAVCFEQYKEYSLAEEYNLACDQSRVMSCLEAKWNSNNVKARYLLQAHK